MGTAPVPNLFTDERGHRRSWGDLHRAVARHINRRYPQATRELREDAISTGLASLWASVERAWLQADAEHRSFERCLSHATSRARRHLARQTNKLKHEVLVSGDDELEHAPIPETEQPDYVAGNLELGERIQAFYDTLTPDEQANFAALLVSAPELARARGISRQAAWEHQRVLERRLRAMAIAAGFLGGSDGFYDHET